MGRACIEVVEYKNVHGTHIKFTFWHCSRLNLNSTAVVHSHNLMLPVGLVIPVEFLTSLTECLSECWLYRIHLACS
jgi:hypothetical protein